MTSRGSGGDGRPRGHATRVGRREGEDAGTHLTHGENLRLSP